MTAGLLAETRLVGTPVVPGLAAGPAQRMADPAGAPAHDPLPEGASVDAAVAQIDAAAALVHRELVAASERAVGTQADLLRTTATMAADRGLTAAAHERVRTHRVVPQRAVWDAATAIAAQFRALGGVLADRGRDVEDVRDRIVAAILDVPPPGLPDPGHPYVLVARDLAPADTARLDPRQVLAIVLEEGGPSSHTAILARAQGIPTVMGVAGAHQIAAGETVAVDGARGTVVTNPDAATLGRVRGSASRRRRFGGRGRTRDGRAVPLFANVGGVEDAAQAAAAGAEGIGLFRTEFCFLDRTDAPGIDEQVDSYRQVLAAFPGRRVVVRTLDAGADKPLPFLEVADEPNPALGARGLRTAARAPQVLDDQLTAIARAGAAEQADVWVMAPMVSTTDELESFVARCASRGLETAGMMIEVPAAAILSRHMMRRAAFASIGTNDLTQYTMAADRMLATLGGLLSNWQPAVLALVAEACRGAHAHGRPIGVCGEAAADPALAVVLAGLGVTSLSMGPASLASVGAVLAETTHADCERIARLVMAATTAEEAQATARAELPVLEDLGL